MIENAEPEVTKNQLESSLNAKANLPEIKEVTPQKWVVYAWGLGLGHFNRSMGLARAATRLGHEVEILSNSHYLISLDLPAFKGITVSKYGDSVPEEFCRMIPSILSDRKFDALVVDMFPLGRFGELKNYIDSVRAVKILSLRTIQSSLLTDEFRAAMDYYDQIFFAGEPSSFDNHPKAIKTAPWFSLNPEELLDRPAAQTLLKVGGDKPCLLVIGCGYQGEAEFMGNIARQLQERFQDRCHIRFASPQAVPGIENINRWPVFKMIKGVDLVVGQGGYNTVNECRAARIPIIALLRERPYDDQSRRVKPHEIAHSPEQVIEKVGELLRNGIPQSDGNVDFENGAVPSAKYISDLVARQMKNQ